MSLKVVLSHQTHYTYERHIALSPHIIRLRPAPHSRTPIEAYSLRIEPKRAFYQLASAVTSHRSFWQRVCISVAWFIPCGYKNCTCDCIPNDKCPDVSLMILLEKNVVSRYLSLFCKNLTFLWLCTVSNEGMCWYLVPHSTYVFTALHINIHT